MNIKFMININPYKINEADNSTGNYTEQKNIATSTDSDLSLSETFPDASFGAQSHRLLVSL